LGKKKYDAYGIGVGMTFSPTTSNSSHYQQDYKKKKKEETTKVAKACNPSY
jgi:hypothetical protein